MPEENMNQEFRFKKTDEIRNHLIEEIYQNELMSKNHKEVCRVFNYVDVPLIVIVRITGCVSISALAFSWNSNRNRRLYSRIKSLCINHGN